MAASLHGFALWFDVTFGGAMPYTNETQLESTVDSNTSDGFHANGVQHKRKREKPLDQIVLSTSPEDTPTHWQQVCRNRIFWECKDASVHCFSCVF